MKLLNRYHQLMEHVFFLSYKTGAREVIFTREQLENAAKSLAIKLPKNLGDVIYTYRYRVALPEKIAACAPPDETWLILPYGIARYAFVATTLAFVKPNRGMAVTKVPDATPGVIGMYALTDEQALLAKLRYNRLIDIFTGLTCYPLQSHLRTTVSGMGQVETDELYVGINRQGVHYILPVQAKRGDDILSIVQVWQDWKMAEEKFSGLVCRPIAAQFIGSGDIALFEFEPAEHLLRIRSEKHYRLVSPSELDPEELQRYKNSSPT